MSNNSADLLINKDSVECVDGEEFDFLGVFPLSNVLDIEEFVTKTSCGYISRNIDYYSVKTQGAFTLEREKCSQLLPMQGKRAFVLAERMLNCSSHVYYHVYCKALQSRNQLEKKEELEAVRLCLEEDAQRLLDVLENKIAYPAKYSLSGGEDVVEGRYIEADNKWILYDSVKRFPKVKHVVCPLLGAALIGPFFKAMHGVSYTNVRFGMHKQQSQKILVNNKLNDLDLVMLKDDKESIPDEFTIVDDNIGTGHTLLILKEAFEKLGKKVKIAGIEMSWDYFDQIKQGIREAESFDPDTISYPTYRDTRHHSVVSGLIDALGKGGDEYTEALKTFGYHNAFMTDHSLLINRGKEIIKKYNIKINSYVD